MRGAGWIVGVVYAALVPTTELGVKAADDAEAAQWWPIDAVPLPLASDHQFILSTAFRQLAVEAAVKGDTPLAALLKAAGSGLDGPPRRV